MEQEKIALAREIAAEYARHAQVEAVALAGSQTSGHAEPDSDIDLYVYLNAALPLETRARLARRRSRYAEIGNQFWEPGDEWVEVQSGTVVDVMFRYREWMEEQLQRVLQHHQAATGYTTCFWYNLRTALVLFDREGWLQRLQAWADQPYPEALRRAIVAKNHPILRRNLSSYLPQLGKAVARRDLVSLNHRLAALLASYFDLLFALNRLPHPGEKRLVAIATRTCTLLPQGMAAQVEALIRAVAQEGNAVLAIAENLVVGLERLLQQEGLI